MSGGEPPTRTANPGRGKRHVPARLESLPAAKVRTPGFSIVVHGRTPSPVEIAVLYCGTDAVSASFGTGRKTVFISDVLLSHCRAGFAALFSLAATSEKSAAVQTFQRGGEVSLPLSSDQGATAGRTAGFTTLSKIDGKGDH